MSEVLLPELGEGIEKATVACWHVRVGDRVEADQDIVEFVTDKATFNVPADRSGVVKELLCREGEEVEIHKPVAVIEES